MADLKILQSSFHGNGRAAPFYAAIIDDPSDGKVKLVIIFDEQDYTAVLSLDSLIENEDISQKAHGYCGDYYDDLLRDALWYEESGE